MQYFFYLVGGLLWFSAFFGIFLSPAVTQEIAWLLIGLNGTVMIVGGAIIQSNEKAKEVDAKNTSHSTSAAPANAPPTTVVIEPIASNVVAPQASGANADAGESDKQTSQPTNAADKTILVAALAIVVLCGVAAKIAWNSLPDGPEAGTNAKAVEETYPPEITGSPQIDTLIAEFNAADAQCVAGDSAACEKRDKEIGKQLNKIGWCSGNKDQPITEYSWHLCDSRSRRY
jgi:hypothetical protein